MREPDLQRLASAVRAQVKWLFVPFALGLIGWYAAQWMPDTSIDRHGSVVSLGLSDEAGYPFYDAILARQAGLLEEQGLVEQAEQATGETALAFEVEADPESSSSRIDVSVWAESKDGAQRLAEHIGRGLVEANRQDKIDRLTPDLRLVANSVDRTREELRVAEAEHEILSTRAGELDDTLRQGGGTGGLAAEESEVAVALDVTSNQVRVIAARLADLEAELARAQLHLDQVAGEVSWLAPPRSLDEVGGSLPTGAVFAAVGALAGVLLVPFLEERFGRVRATSLPEAFHGAEVLDVSRKAHFAGFRRADAVAYRIGSYLSPENSGIAVFTDGSASLREVRDLISAGGLTVFPENPDGIDEVLDVMYAELYVIGLSERCSPRSAQAVARSIEELPQKPVIVVFGTPVSVA